MAMSMAGKNKHYYWNEILKHHWASMARIVRFPAEELDEINHELLDTMEDVISRVAAQLPVAFPMELAEAVFDGMRGTKSRLSMCCPHNESL